MPQSEVLSVRMPAGTHAKLASVAQNLERSQNWVVNQAIDHYLSVYEWQRQEIEKAIAEADAGGQFYSAEEVEQRLERFKR